MSISIQLENEDKNKPLQVLDINKEQTSSSSEISSYSPNSYESNPSEEKKIIEEIQTKNLTIKKKLTEKIMKLKYNIRDLMNPYQNQTNLAVPNHIRHYSTPIEEFSNTMESKFENASQTGHHFLINSLVQIKKLKQQHRRAQSELCQNLEKIQETDMEKSILQKELLTLQDVIIIECEKIDNRKCCNIF